MGLDWSLSILASPASAMTGRPSMVGQGIRPRKVTPDTKPDAQVALESERGCPMKSKGRSFYMAWQLLLVVTFAVAGAGQPTPEDRFTPLISSVKGPDLFRAYCASCHGLDAKGTGPAARALKAEVPDLTVLTRTNHGQFPTLRVRQMIMGIKLWPHTDRERCQFGDRSFTRLKRTRILEV